MEFENGRCIASRNVYITIPCLQFLNTIDRCMKWMLRKISGEIPWRLSAFVAAQIPATKALRHKIVASSKNCTNENRYL